MTSRPSAEALKKVSIDSPPSILLPTLHILVPLTHSHCTPNMPSKPEKKALSKPTASWQQDGLDSESDEAGGAPLRLDSDEEDSERDGSSDDDDEDDDAEEEEYNEGSAGQGPSRPRFEAEGSGSGSDVSFTDSEEEQSADEEVSRSAILTLHLCLTDILLLTDCHPQAHCLSPVRHARQSAAHTQGRRCLRLRGRRVRGRSRAQASRSVGAAQGTEGG